MPTLRLVRERRLADLIPPPRERGVLEASGVFANGRDCFVIFDNVRRVARIDRGLAPGSSRHAWLGHMRRGEGYEDIAYNPHTKRFYLLIEAEKHPDGTFKAVIEECDAAFKYKGRRWADVVFEKRNTGFEGLSALRWQGGDYLLALCEGNRCKAGRKGRKKGGGRIYVLQKRRGRWESVARMKLPRRVRFEDYAAVAVRGQQIAVVSQQDSRLWLGRFRPGDWTIVGRGRQYDFPRTKKGKRLYCTVEGISWLTATTFVAVSDLSKKNFPSRCDRKDQSIHVFRVPRGS
ncbi:MAG: hypothetical protein DMF91_10690 [Acidobacteria bacterium]|nr:MAG: hypothetical protein DMF91_10690 [Acidobacteriota bacterium]